MKQLLKQKPFILLLAGLIAFVIGNMLVATATSCAVNTCQADYVAPSGITVKDGTPHVNYAFVQTGVALLWIGVIVVIASVIVIIYRRIRAEKR